MESIELCRTAFFSHFCTHLCYTYGIHSVNHGGGRILGARIAALRKEKRLSQAELADKLGISPSAVGMYEQGRREPCGALLVNMAKEFGVTTDFLLTGNAGAIDEARLLRLLRHRLEGAENLLSAREDVPFSRQELVVLLTAMLLE